MDATRRCLVLAVVIVGAGCALMIPEETRYLKEAQHRATQQEVQARLGQPRSVVATETGQSIWVYEIRTIEPGGQNTWVTAGSWCDEYTLTFDQAGVLQHWAHKSYLHGGEMMPASCNSIMGVPKPAL